MKKAKLTKKFDKRALIQGVKRGEKYTLSFGPGSIGLGLDKVFAAEEEHGGEYDGEYLGVEVQKIVKGKQADDQNLNPNNKTKIMVGDLLVAVVSVHTKSKGRACA